MHEAGGALVSLSNCRKVGQSLLGWQRGGAEPSVPFLDLDHLEVREGTAPVTSAR